MVYFLINQIKMRSIFHIRYPAPILSSLSSSTVHFPPSPVPRCSILFRFRCFLPNWPFLTTLFAGHLSSTFSPKFAFSSSLFSRFMMETASLSHSYFQKAKKICFLLNSRFCLVALEIIGPISSHILKISRVANNLIVRTKGP